MPVVYEIRERGSRGHKRYQIVRSFDFGDGFPLRLEVEDVFDNYEQASQQRVALIKLEGAAEKKKDE
jgi:hypothetical protein